MFKETVSEDELDLSHMINNRAFGGLLFRGINGVGIAGREVRTAVGGDEREGNRIFRKEMVQRKGAWERKQG
jgi:hypothetical protein